MMIKIVARNMPAVDVVEMIALADEHEILNFDEFVKIVRNHVDARKSHKEEVHRLNDGVLRIVSEGSVFFVLHVQDDAMCILISGKEKDCRKIERYFNLDNEVGASVLAEAMTGAFLHVKDNKNK